MARKETKKRGIASISDILGGVYRKQAGVGSPSSIPNPSVISAFGGIDAARVRQLDPEQYRPFTKY